MRKRRNCNSDTKERRFKMQKIDMNGGRKVKRMDRGKVKCNSDMERGKEGDRWTTCWVASEIEDGKRKEEEKKIIKHLRAQERAIFLAPEQV